VIAVMDPQYSAAPSTSGHCQNHRVFVGSASIRPERCRCNIDTVWRYSVGRTPSRVLGEMNNPNPGSLGSMAATILNKLTADLAPDQRRLLTEPTGVHTPLLVLRKRDVLFGPIFLVAHEVSPKTSRTREALYDPQLTLLRVASGDWIPLSIITPFRTLATARASGKLQVVDPAEHERLVHRVNVWMRNVELAKYPLPSGVIVERRRIGAIDAHAAE
jgi:hypothetical protein